MPDKDQMPNPNPKAKQNRDQAQSGQQPDRSNPYQGGEKIHGDKLGDAEHRKMPKANSKN